MGFETDEEDSDQNENVKTSREHSNVHKSLKISQEFNLIGNKQLDNAAENSSRNNYESKSDGDFIDENEEEDEEEESDEDEEYESEIDELAEVVEQVTIIYWENVERLVFTYEYSAFISLRRIIRV